MLRISVLTIIFVPLTVIFVVETSYLLICKIINKNDPKSKIY